MRVKTGSKQSNIFDILSHVDTMAARKSSLERLGVIDWESFRPILLENHSYEDQTKGGRPPWCPVLMLKVLVLQRLHDLGDQEMVPRIPQARETTKAERPFQLADRFSFLRFVGLRSGDSVPDHSTIWAFKEGH